MACTRVPSKRNRTEVMALPWRSQKAAMSFSSFVLRLILKKTSLLLSVTLIFRCSALAGGSGRSAEGLLCSSDMLNFARKMSGGRYTCVAWISTTGTTSLENFDSRSGSRTQDKAGRWRGRNGDDDQTARGAKKRWRFEGRRSRVAREGMRFLYEIQRRRGSVVSLEGFKTVGRWVRVLRA